VHQEGCADIQLDLVETMGWLEDHSWVAGIILLAIGFVLMVFGKRWFPYVVASLIALFTMGLVA